MFTHSELSFQLVLKKGVAFFFFWINATNCSLVRFTFKQTVFASFPYGCFSHVRCDNWSLYFQNTSWCYPERKIALDEHYQTTVLLCNQFCPWSGQHFINGNPKLSLTLCINLISPPHFLKKKWGSKGNGDWNNLLNCLTMSRKKKNGTIILNCRSLVKMKTQLHQKQ